MDMIKLAKKRKLNNKILNLKMVDYCFIKKNKNKKKPKYSILKKDS